MTGSSVGAVSAPGSLTVISEAALEKPPCERYSIVATKKTQLGTPIVAIDGHPFPVSCEAEKQKNKIKRQRLLLTLQTLPHYPTV